MDDKVRYAPTVRERLPKDWEEALEQLHLPGCEVYVNETGVRVDKVQKKVYNHNEPGKVKGQTA